MQAEGDDEGYDDQLEVKAAEERNGELRRAQRRDQCVEGVAHVAGDLNQAEEEGSGDEELDLAGTFVHAARARYRSLLRARVGAPLHANLSIPASSWSR